MTQALLQNQSTASATSRSLELDAKPESLLLDNTAFKGILPSTFRYAASTASYQIEGAAYTDGKGLSVWDEFLKGKENGDEACDSYHLYKEDINLLKQYGVNTYRFSIAWARVLPDGTGEVNEQGIRYYSDLVRELLRHADTRLTPFLLKVSRPS